MDLFLEVVILKTYNVRVDICFQQKLSYHHQHYLTEHSRHFLCKVEEANTKLLF